MQECFESMTQGYRRLYSPPWSPDFNKCAQHAIGATKRGASDQIKMQQQELSVDQVWEVLDKVAHKSITPESVKKDVDSLHFMLRVIAAEPSATIVAENGKKEYQVLQGAGLHLISDELALHYAAMKCCHVHACTAACLPCVLVDIPLMLAVTTIFASLIASAP